MMLGFCKQPMYVATRSYVLFGTTFLIINIFAPKECWQIGVKADYYVVYYELNLY